MENGYPKYQYSIFLKDGKDEQIVIRADDFDELIEAKKDIDKILEKRQKDESVKDPDPEWIQETRAGKPLCPECKEGMVKREGAKGEFWGCSKFPDCRGTRQI